MSPSIRRRTDHVERAGVETFAEGRVDQASWEYQGRRVLSVACGQAGLGRFRHRSVSLKRFRAWKAPEFHNPIFGIL